MSNPRQFDFMSDSWVKPEIEHLFDTADGFIATAQMLERCKESTRADPLYEAATYIRLAARALYPLEPNK